jgi:hypothetical protein
MVRWFSWPASASLSSIVHSFISRNMVWFVAA